MQELDDFINKAKQLPAAPRVLPQLLHLLNQPDIDTGRVVDLITFDPGLTANLLQLCNSAYFGGANPVADVQEAIMRVGFKDVYRMVAAVSGSRAMATRQTGYGIDQSELWKHSVSTAITAQLIARDLGDDENLVFTAGLLHDIGKVVLSEALEGIYDKLVKEVEVNKQTMIEAEKQLLGVQHAEIGGRLLARWNFPPSIVIAVWFHHAPETAARHQRLAAYIYLGNMISYMIGHGYGHQAFAIKEQPEALRILGLGSDALPRYMMQTLDQFQTVEALLSVN